LFNFHRNCLKLYLFSFRFKIYLNNRHKCNILSHQSIDSKNNLKWWWRGQQQFDYCLRILNWFYISIMQSQGLELERGTGIPSCHFLTQCLHTIMRVKKSNF
jgi:hypothetical protein